MSATTVRKSKKVAQAAAPLEAGQGGPGEGQLAPQVEAKPAESGKAKSETPWLPEEIAEKLKALREIYNKLVESGKLDKANNYVLALDEVKLMDRLLLLGPPGVGKSETIYRLSVKRAVEDGRIFVDVRCLMSIGGCPVTLREIRESLKNVKDSVVRENILRWLKDVKNVDEKGIAFLTSSDKELEGNSELGEYAERKVNIHYEDVVKNPAWFYVYLRVSAPHVFPEDLQYPKPDSGSGGVEFLLPKAFHLFTLPGIKGTLFLDEITNVQRDDQMAMYYTLVLDKELGYAGKLQNEVYVVAAGNPPEWSSIARGLPAALLDRFAVVNIKPPTVREWLNYMNSVYGDKWNKAIGVFLLANEDVLLGKPTAEETLTKFPTPRSWTFLALRSDDEIVKYAPGIVGLEVAARLYSYLSTPIPTLEDLNEDPKKFSSLDTSVKYLTLLPIAMMDPWEAARRGGNFIQWLVENDPEYMAVLVAITHYVAGNLNRALAWLDVAKKLAPKEYKKLESIIGAKWSEIRSLQNR